MTDEARVVALDRLRPGDIADRSGELLDVVFGWADLARLRRQVAAQCADAGLILRRAASGLRCLVAGTIPRRR
ncbi:MAG TPA: hypothetical protein VLM11_15160 [Streptosporangiaceae bacterium]|nr:hypothetical protein [Streptosporangiaceae bacterium]